MYTTVTKETTEENQNDTVTAAENATLCSTIRRIPDGKADIVYVNTAEHEVIYSLSLLTSVIATNHVYCRWLILVIWFLIYV